MAMFRRGGGARGSRVNTSSVLTGLSVLIIPLWLLAFLAWCVQLAGVAAIEKQQEGRHYLMFDWFVTSFEFVALMLVPFHLLARRSSPGIVALLGVVTTLLILRTNVWNDARLIGADAATPGATQIDSVVNPVLAASSARVKLLFSGYLITSFFNLMLMLVFGNLPASSAQDAQLVENKGRVAAAEHHHNNGVAGTAPNYPAGTTGPGGIGGTSAV